MTKFMAESSQKIQQCLRPGTPKSGCEGRAKDEGFLESLLKKQLNPQIISPNLTNQKAFGQRNTSTIEDGVTLLKLERLHMYICMLNAEIYPATPPLSSLLSLMDFQNTENQTYFLQGKD